MQCVHEVLTSPIFTAAHAPRARGATVQSAGNTGPTLAAVGEGQAEHAQPRWMPMELAREEVGLVCRLSLPLGHPQESRPFQRSSSHGN